MAHEPIGSVCVFPPLRDTVLQHVLKFSTSSSFMEIKVDLSDKHSKFNIDNKKL